MRLAKTAGFAGAMRHKVEIQNRDISPGTIDHAEDFTPAATVQAAIKTRGPGLDIFDDQNNARTVTHEIIIRDRPGLTAENWILFDGRRFDILSIEHIQERDRYMRLFCNERGPADAAANVL